MLVPEKVSLSDFVTRRLHPMKVAMAYIRHELATHTTGEKTTMTRDEVVSVLATMEIFVEDYEKLVTREPRPASMPAVERTFVSDARS